MPTYDYRCDACSHEFEVFESITVDPQTKCPECKKKKLRRLFGAGAGLVFKGSGFYQTDYRSDSYTKAAAADKPASESTSGTSSESKGDSKSAPKAETKSSETKSTDSKSSDSKKRA